MNKEYNYGTLKEAIDKWNKKETVWSGEMGGLGPGYEQCIQVLTFEICKELYGKKIEEKTFREMAKPIVHKLDDKMGGFSGAQVGVAMQIAYKFLTMGYNEALQSLKKQDADRLIQVSNS